ncbi:hypothetical protein COLO4_04246 [Corchorus olitorius]|uniref:Uncharacterized protein n=1 Tax=Corchorus olitorius TaxID=93759 RepID=A0A1R3KUU9_9ROSI|nr:hypothetical protein COLO4_04246 [Corchorus olitorius]
MNSRIMEEQEENRAKRNVNGKEGAGRMEWRGCGVFMRRGVWCGEAV